MVNNAGILGPSPLPALVELTPEDLRSILEVNVIAPLALVQEMAGLLRSAPSGRVITVSSDAAVSAYRGWGDTGRQRRRSTSWRRFSPSRPYLSVWAVDPGDLRTDMHQQVLPRRGHSDRPEPATVVPGFLALIGSELPAAATSSGTSSQRRLGHDCSRFFVRVDTAVRGDRLRAPGRQPKPRHPPKRGGPVRDYVRLMVSYRSNASLDHRHFRELAEILEPGDVLVVNVSATVPAALLWTDRQE